MKFRLTVTSLWIDNQDNILKQYPQLADRIETVGDDVYVNVETIEELMELVKIEGSVVVEDYYNDEPTIEIYDTYRE